MQFRIHKQEKEQFIKLFRHDNVDRFEDRFKVLEAFLKTEQHLTADEMTSLLGTEGIDLEPEFIRDTLKLMCRYGFADKNRFNNGELRYEHRHLGQHHDHMICTKCGLIFEFENHRLEQLQAQIAGDHGFHLLQHKMELYGICTDCLKERALLMPLVSAKQGERLVVKAFRGGAKSRMRLLTMGLRIGDKVDIISNINQGRVVVAADFKRLVLGRGLAEKIMVQQQTDDI
ncbi:MAG: Fur family transcriptional regulator [Desulfobacteraceae bacterium]|nr:Fur family transcriptional regulator [Desulfobacteraceae bacterium]